MHLLTLDPKSLRIFANDRDLLRDLFTYLDYVCEHSVKRMTRTNEIPKSDAVRIARLLGDPELIEVCQETGGAMWINLLDSLALQMSLVNYDLKGEYRSFNSSNASFTDNYILPNKSALEKFNSYSPIKQEKQILFTLIHHQPQSEYGLHSHNEFYHVGVLSELDPFNSRGSATGVIPLLNFPEIRQFLLTVLKACPAGQWISTASLIAFLKANHPYFLIPQKLPQPRNKWETISSRYGNFYEGKDLYYADKPVEDSAPDAFERVEGRYVERFLENIPLVMRFVDVAYDPEPYTGLLPKRGILKAFRVNERFLRLFNEQESPPKVTVQPNFDVVVESDFYPASLIRQVAALGEQVSNAQSGHSAYVGIFLLKKTAVAAAQVKDPQLDVIALLEQLSGRDLPPNVRIEIEEWAGHADQFTLYDGFGLLEMEMIPPDVVGYVAEKISQNLHLVHNPGRVFNQLETLGRIPVHILHSSGEVVPLADSFLSVFPKESAVSEARKTVSPVKVAKVVTVSYKFSDAEAFNAVKMELAKLRVPFQSDPAACTVIIQQGEQAKFYQAVEQLASEYRFEIDS